MRVFVFLPPIRGSHVPVGCQCVFPAAQPDSRSACSLSPLLSKSRQSCLLGGRGSNAGPDALDGGMSFYLREDRGDNEDILLIPRQLLKIHMIIILLSFLNHFYFREFFMRLNVEVEFAR